MLGSHRSIRARLARTGILLLDAWGGPSGCWSLMLQDMKSVFDRGFRPFQLIGDLKYCNTFCLQFDEPGLVGAVPLKPLPNRERDLCTIIGRSLFKNIEPGGAEVSDRRSALAIQKFDFPFVRSSSSRLSSSSVHLSLLFLPIIRSRSSSVRSAGPSVRFAARLDGPLSYLGTANIDQRCRSGSASRTTSFTVIRSHRC
jgi:hypothetical protein